MGFNVLWILPTGSFDHPTFSVNLLNFVQCVKSKQEWTVKIKVTLALKHF